MESTTPERERPSGSRELHVEQSAVRCPFCHSGIEVASEPWVACASCLARHHRDCAAESHACASCGAASFLRVAAPAAPRSGRSPAVDAGLGYLTLGIYPIVRSELELGAHDERHGPDEGLGQLGTFRRLVAVFGALAVAFAVMIAFMFATNGPPPAGSPGEGPLMMAFTLVIQLLAIGPVAAYLHATRELLRKHEERTLGPTHEAEWRSRRRTDLAITAFGLVPMVGVLALFAVSARVRGALELHEDHEGAKSARRRPPPGK